MGWKTEGRLLLEWHFLVTDGDVAAAGPAPTPSSQQAAAIQAQQNILGAYAASAGPGIGPEGGPAQAGLYAKLYGPGGLAAAAAGNKILVTSWVEIKSKTWKSSPNLNNCLFESYNEFSNIQHFDWSFYNRKFGKSYKRLQPWSRFRNLYDQKAAHGMDAAHYTHCALLLHR